MRTCSIPDKLREQIESRVETATKGEVARWLDALKIAPWVQQTTDTPLPTDTPTVRTRTSPSQDVAAAAVTRRDRPGRVHGETVHNESERTEIRRTLGRPLPPRPDVRPRVHPGRVPEATSAQSGHRSVTKWR